MIKGLQTLDEFLASTRAGKKTFKVKGNLSTISELEANLLADPKFCANVTHKDGYSIIEVNGAKLEEAKEKAKELELYVDEIIDKVANK